MCKSPVSGVLKDGMGEGVSGLDGVSHHVGKPRLLEQKMGPENGVISWLPDIYIYIYGHDKPIYIIYLSDLKSQ